MSFCPGCLWKPPKLGVGGQLARLVRLQAIVRDQWGAHSSGWTAETEPVCQCWRQRSERPPGRPQRALQGASWRVAAHRHAARCRTAGSSSCGGAAAACPPLLPTGPPPRAPHCPVLTPLTPCREFSRLPGGAQPAAGRGRLLGAAAALLAGSVGGVALCLSPDPPHQQQHAAQQAGQQQQAAAEAARAGPARAGAAPAEPKEPDLWDRWEGIKAFLGGWRKGAAAEVPLPMDKLTCHLPPGGARCRRCRSHRLDRCRCAAAEGLLQTGAVAREAPGCVCARRQRCRRAQPGTPSFSVDRPCLSHPAPGGAQGTAPSGTAPRSWCPAAPSTPPPSCTCACWSWRASTSQRWGGRWLGWGALQHLAQSGRLAELSRSAGVPAPRKGGPGGPGWPSPATLGIGRQAGTRAPVPAVGAAQPTRLPG